MFFGVPKGNDALQIMEMHSKVGGPHALAWGARSEA